MDRPIDDMIREMIQYNWPRFKNQNRQAIKLLHGQSVLKTSYIHF